MRQDNASFQLTNSLSSKEPRYTIELSFDLANTDLHYFTSHDDAKTPASTTKTSSVISLISGTSQKIAPDKGLASIGAISIRLVDINSQISTLFNTKLDTGNGLSGKRVRVYTSFIDEEWANYVLIQTQIIDTIQFDKGYYTLKLADIQRSERKNIFDLAKTTLSQSIDSTQLLIPVYSINGFNTIQHGVSYSDAPNQTVLYIKIEKEVIRCTGTTTDQTLGLSFVVDSNGRGVLNTAATSHTIDNSLQDNSRKTKVDEYVYLELPAVKLIYAILTGNLEGQSGQVLPSSWHLNIDTSFVRLTDFTAIGTDWWDTTNDSFGIVVSFKGLKKQDAKRFIEIELNLLLGSFNPIYSTGEIGLKRMTKILAGTAYLKQLDESNVMNYGALQHDFRSVLNSFQINWNYDDNIGKFTRTSSLIDNNSISLNGTSKLKEINLKGMDGQRHTEESIFNLFNSLRDRYAGPPIRLKVNCLPSLNVLEVGDIVNVNLKNVRDFNGALSNLNRQFEIQSVNINWITGLCGFDLFASSQSADALNLSTQVNVLNDAYYLTSGNELKAYLDLNYPGSFTIIGGIGHIISDVTLPGATPSTIYYYDNPLTIDFNVIVTITNNVQLKVKGHLTIDGTIDGIGGGALGISPDSLDTKAITPGISEYLGNTNGGGVISTPFGIYSIENITTTGEYETTKFYTLINDKTNDALVGLPTNLKGSSGGPGGNAVHSFVFSVPGTTQALGGKGGNGGSGLITITRGLSFGVSGKVDLSGLPGLDGSSWDNNNRKWFAGGGAGGSPGCWLLLLDGNFTIPDIANGFKANQGNTPVNGTPMEVNSTGSGFAFDINTVPPVVSSFYTGSGIQGENRLFAAHRIQFIPEDITAIPDVPDQTTVPPTNLVLTSGDNELLKNNDGTIVSRIKASWTASIDQNIGGYEVEFKLTTDTTWLPASMTVNLEITMLFIAPVQDGLNYDIRVRAINNIGVRSIWLSKTNHTVIGKLAPPPKVDAFSVQVLADGTRVFAGGLLSTNRPTDFAGYVISAAVGNGLAWADLSPLHVGLITQLPFETNQLAAGQYTVGMKAVDTSGNESLNAVLIDSTLGDPRIQNALLTVNFLADGWPDTKTNAWVDPYVFHLIATSINTWDDFTNDATYTQWDDFTSQTVDWDNWLVWEDWTTWDQWLAWVRIPNSPVIYETASIDIGAILNYTPLVTVTSNATTTLIEESHSDDDITFTPYANAGTLINSRYLKLKLTFSNTTEAVIVTQASLIVDSATLEEYINDLQTSGIDLGSPRVPGDIRLPIVKSYTVINNVQLALQNVGAGWSWEIIDKNVIGPRIKIYNASNVSADALIDARIIGA